MILRYILFYTVAGGALTDEKLRAKNLRLQHKMNVRYEKALRKANKMERKLLKRKHDRSVYPTMAHQGLVRQKIPWNLEI